MDEVDVWIGLSRQSSQSDWLWTDLVFFPHDHEWWSYGEPGEHELCARLKCGENKLYGIECNGQYGFTCEKGTISLFDG